MFSLKKKPVSTWHELPLTQVNYLNHPIYEIHYLEFPSVLKMITVLVSDTPSIFLISSI
jgi:hypothetical protein